MSTVENGNTVTVHYTGTLNNGTQFDSSRSREPLVFQVGDGQVIAGFDNAVLGMEIGESKTFTVPANEAYGLKNEDAIQEVSKKVMTLRLAIQLQDKMKQGNSSKQ